MLLHVHFLFLIEVESDQKRRLKRESSKEDIITFLADVKKFGPKTQSPDTYLSGDVRIYITVSE